jgi:hypothetical protein
MLGLANGAEAALISGLKCGTTAGLTDGFGTCIGMGITNNTFITKVANSILINSGNGFGITQGSEGLYLSDSMIARNTIGINNTTGTNLHITSSSLDDNGTGISSSGGGTIECYDCHYENLGVPASAASYVVLTNSSGYISYGGSMQDDQSTGTTAQFIQGNSGACYVGMFGTSVTTLGRTLTQIVNFAGSCRGDLHPRYTSLNVSSDFNQAFTGGPVFDYPIGAQSGVNNVAGFFATALQFRNGSGFVSAPGGNLYALSIGNPGAPRSISLSDPGGAATWGLSLNAVSGTYQSKRTVSGCTTAASIGGICASNITVTWNTAFPDANYTVSCQGNSPTNAPANPYIVTSSKAAASVQLNYFAITAAAASFATVECTATHD